MVEVTTLDEALSAVGIPGLRSSRRPVVHSSTATLVTLATLNAAGAPSWYGIWIGAGGARFLGEPLPRSLLAQTSKAPTETLELIDLLQAAYRSYVEVLEEFGGRLDILEARSDPAPIAELSSLLRGLAGVRKQIVRLEVLMTELDGPLGARFAGVEAFLAPLRAEVSHLDELSSGLAQSLRDLMSIRNAVEANALAVVANKLGEVSNRIAALANTSNLRMLGVAYIALAIALVSVVVLIPNTGATILGMPSAAWVPGFWVDVILVVLAVVPLLVVFSRRWVLNMLQGLPAFEIRTAEGLSDLPEIRAQNVNDQESRLRQSP